MAYERAATAIQKCYRGFVVRKAYQLYRQRLNTQILCFLQQIELISNDFFTKIIKTNYSVSFKCMDSSAPNVTHQHKYAQKLSQYFFPPPPPLPSPFAVLSPPLPPLDASCPVKSSTVSSSIPLPPPPALFLASRPSLQSHVPSASANRSPSPSPSSGVSKFAQVRDIFARAEAAAAGIHHHHHHYHHPPPPPPPPPTSHFHHHQHIPLKPHTNNQLPPVLAPPINPISHLAPSMERIGSPRSLTVLNAVQEYQRQHINNQQAAQRRFSHLGGGIHIRPPNPNGNMYLKSRGIVPMPPNNHKSFLPNRPAPLSGPPNFISPLLKQIPLQQHQPLKPLTRVSSSGSSEVVSFPSMTLSSAGRVSSRQDKCTNTNHRKTPLPLTET